MKYLLSIFFVAFSLVLVTGCKDLLEKEPLAQISTSSNYLTGNDALAAVTAAYNPLTANNWTGSFPGYMDWVFANVSSDDAEKGGESGSDQLYAQQIALFNIPADNDAIRFGWQSQYVGVRRANLVLDNVPPIKMDETLKNRLLAEAKFLRAYYYFKLVKTYGDIPLVLSSKISEYNLARTPKQDVYKQIVKDLTEAEQVLPARSKYAAGDYGRATSGAARAYLGLVHLYLNDFPKAQEWFKKVIDSGEYSLDPKYYNLFTVAGENSPEIIFSVQFKNDLSVPVNNQLGIVNGSRAMYGWGFNLPTQDFVNAFEKGDPRLKHSVYANGDTLPDGLIAKVGNSTTGFLNKKAYIQEGEKVGGQYQAGKDEIMMRLGKVLLWYAEAALKTGNTQVALDALNLVRKRARENKPAVLPDITEKDPTALLTIIWHEQRVEFGFEGERFFELVRQGRAESVLKDYARKYNSLKGANFRKGVNEIFPIPAAEINLSNGVLVQNPGY